MQEADQEERYTVWDGVKAVIAPLTVSPDNLKLRQSDYEKLGIPKGTAVEVVKYMIWRHRALNLASFLGLVISVLVYQKFADQVQSLDVANGWCEQGNINLGSVSDEASLSLPPIVAVPTERKFPAATDYSNMLNYACPAEVDELMPVTIFPHVMRLTKEQGNNFCGLFETECDEEPVEGESMDPCGAMCPDPYSP
jgi:hypothetical protein